MSAGRLLSLMLLLQSRGRLSARAIAGELGVSVRTAYRDLVRLQAAGIPVYAEPGRGGGYQLLEGYRTRLTGMSEGEARALFFASLPGPAADLGLTAEVTAARLKLLAALPAGLREEAARTAAVFHLDAPAWYREPEPTPLLPLFVDALLTGRAVDVRYRRWRAPQEVGRRLCPYGLVLKSGVWYLVAAGGSRIATYRVAQVLEAVLSEERFDRPQGFDLGAYWTSYLEDFHARRWTGTATIRLSPRGRRRLPDNVPPEVVRAVDSTAVPVGDDGWVEAVIPTESTDHACGELLRLGIDIEVLAPAELRQAMTATVGALARAYGLQDQHGPRPPRTMEEETVKRIGIIGAGEIGRAIVTGLCDGGDKSPEVFLSPRGARTAAELSARYEGVQVCADNQEVVDRSELVIIAVRRQDRHGALAGLRVDDDKIVVNVMAGVANDELRRTLATDAPLVRAIPLPAIRERRSVTVTYPTHPVVDPLFECLGGVLPVADEAAFNVFSALTGTLTTHYSYLATLTSWAADQGIASDHADRYIRGLFQGVGRALSDETRSLHQLAADHETPNGNNERIRTTWFGPANSEALHKALDGLLADLT